MPDRGIVIKGIECHINPVAPCSDCPYDDRSACDYSLLVDALELLQEQENEYEKGFNDCLALLKEQPDIVRCKECKYYSNGFCYNPNTFDSEKTCGNTVPDWFCADGERRETNE